METIIISIFGIGVVCLLTFFSLRILNSISKAIDAEDKPEPKPSNEHKKKKKKEETAVASAPSEVFLNDAPKACAFLQSQGIKPNPRTTKFFRVIIDRKFQPSWLSRDVSGQYYTFGAKGENLQKHSAAPYSYDYCSRDTIILYGKQYRVINDNLIMPA